MVTRSTVLSVDLWESPVLTGSRPPPSDGFTFTSIDAHRAVIFGGILHNRSYVNDIYIIDFQKMVSITDLATNLFSTTTCNVVLPKYFIRHIQCMYFVLRSVKSLRRRMENLGQVGEWNMQPVALDLVNVHTFF